MTMVNKPDESHRTKANAITARGTDECWLIVRSDKIKAWQDYIAKAPSKYPSLVRCFGICEFIGQNLTETRWRSSNAASDPLRDVIAKLNELVAKLGSQFLPAAGWTDWLTNSRCSWPTGSAKPSVPASWRP